MARLRRSSEQTLEFKIEQAEAKVAKTREAHEKVVDELKKLYDIKKAYQRDELLKAMKSKICANRQEYDAMTEELKKLLDEKYPERKPEKIKSRLYDAYVGSDRSLDEIIAFMEGRNDDIDW